MPSVSTEQAKAEALARFQDPSPTLRGTFTPIQAAIRWYSLISPASLVTRTTSPSAWFEANWGSGVSRDSPRWGRSLL